MKITRQDIISDEAKAILDITLTNEESKSAASAIQALAAYAATVQPPWGAMVGILINSHANEIHAKNKGHGVNAYVHYWVGPSFKYPVQLPGPESVEIVTRNTD